MDTKRNTSTVLLRAVGVLAVLAGWMLAMREVVSLAIAGAPDRPPSEVGASVGGFVTVVWLGVVLTSIGVSLFVSTIARR